MQRRQATLDAVCSGVTVKQDGDPNRKRVKDEIKKFLAKKSLLKDSKTVDVERHAQTWGLACPLKSELTTWNPVPYCMHKSDKSMTSPFHVLATLTQYARASEATMSRIGLGLLLGITLMGAGCGYSHNYMNGNGMPAITQLMPSSATANSGAFVLTVNGSGFGTDALVYWGTGTRTTTYVSTSKVTANITDADIMNPGMVQVYVRSGGANSNAVPFTVQ